MSSSNAPSGPENPDQAPDTPRNTGAEATPVAVDLPPAAIEVGAPSGERRSRQPRRQSRGTPEDTLLSMPAPAPTFEVEVEDRLSDQERRVDDLANRVRALEARQGQPGPAGAAALGTQSWLVWVVFLLALAVAWQIFTRGR